MSTPVSTLVSDAAAELNLLQPGVSPSNADGQLMIRILNRLIGLMNADRDLVWCDVFLTNALVPGTQPHTIGPSGATWTTAIRPVTIDGCQLLITNVTPAVKVPVNVRDREWWNAQPVANTTYANTITSSVVTDIYYEADWPNGKIFMFPAPTTNYSMILTTRTLLGVYALTDSIDVPPGYEMWLVKKLAMLFATPFGRVPPPQTVLDEREAREILEANNLFVPTLVTRDAGMPGGVDHRPDFYWPNGSIR